ncbi:hypothetical protein [Luteolibacter sp. AS25]|uniref:hypothetical protein n=1 Tax=Luteolibacter sp. AS25 TaxID=3135776 RepID=UPI00398B83D9
MKYITLALSLFFVSCAGMFPGVGILAPETVAGYEMDATGLKGSYYYKFAADGTYDRETVLPSGEKSEPKKGIWKWERSSTKDATLTLDNSLVVTLNFTTHEHANASLVDGDRLYPVEFAAP